MKRQDVETAIELAMLAAGWRVVDHKPITCGKDAVGEIRGTEWRFTRRALGQPIWCQFVMFDDWIKEDEEQVVAYCLHQAAVAYDELVRQGVPA